MGHQWSVSAFHDSASGCLSFCVNISDQSLHDDRATVDAEFCFLNCAADYYHNGSEVCHSHPFKAMLSKAKLSTDFVSDFWSSDGKLTHFMGNDIKYNFKFDLTIRIHHYSGSKKERKVSELSPE